MLAVAYNKRAQLELEARTAAFRPRATTLNALGHRLLGQHRGQAPRVLDEREVRRIVEGLVPSRQRRANTDPLAPYLEGLSADPARPPRPRRRRGGARRRPRPGRRLRPVPGRPGPPGRRRLRRADLRRHRGAAAATARSGAACRPRHRHLLVDEFQDLTPAHVLLVRLLAAPGARRVRRGRRRPGDLRPRRRRPAVPHRLRRPVPRGRVPPARGQLPLPGGRRRRRRPRSCSATTTGGWPRRSGAGPAPTPTRRALVGASTTRPKTAPPTSSTSCRAGSTRGSPHATIAVLTRVNSLLLAPARRAGRGRAAGGARRCRPRCSSAPACGPRSPTCASGPAATASTRGPRRGPAPAQPRLARSGSPKWFDAAACRSTSCRHRRSPIDDAKVGAKVHAPGRRPRRRRRRRRPQRHDPRRSSSRDRDDVGLGGAMSHARQLRRAARRRRHLDDLDALAPGRRPPPRPGRRSSRGCAACSTGDADAATASPSPPSTGSRAWSGIGWSSPA